MTPLEEDFSVAALRAAYPDPDALPREMRRELEALAEVMRAAEPHWHTRMPGRTWTPAQEAEHTILVNEGSGRVVRLLLSGRAVRPAPQDPGRTENGRRLAPQGTLPGDEGQPLGALLARHAASAALLEVQAAPDPERTFYHAFLGPLDALDWLRMAAWQTRHHRQTLQAGLNRLNAGERAAG